MTPEVAHKYRRTIQWMVSCGNRLGVVVRAGRHYGKLTQAQLLVGCLSLGVALAKQIGLKQEELGGILRTLWDATSYQRPH